MSEFRIGDREVEVNGQSVRLRLTVSGLAEIAARFVAADAGDLAGKLRKAGQGDWNRVYAALATPRPMGALTESELAKIMPDISAVIADGLNP